MRCEVLSLECVSLFQFAHRATTSHTSVARFGPRDFFSHLVFVHVLEILERCHGVRKGRQVNLLDFGDLRELLRSNVGSGARLQRW